MARVDSRRAHHHLGAVGPQECHLLGGDLVGHGEDAAVAAAGGDDGQPDPGVARGGLDDRSSRPEESVAFGRVDHGHGGTVLDAAAGVEELEFGQQLAGEVASDPIESDERGVADEVQQRIGRLDGRTRVTDRGDVDGRTDRQGDVAQHLDRETGPVQLAGSAGQPSPALVAVGCDHADRAGDVGAQVGDELRWQRAVGDVHPSPGPCGQALGNRGFVDYDQDVRGGTPVLARGRTTPQTGPGPAPPTRPMRGVPRWSVGVPAGGIPLRVASDRISRATGGRRTVVPVEARPFRPLRVPLSGRSARWPSGAPRCSRGWRWSKGRPRGPRPRSRRPGRAR